jgi:hypothetical protein
MALLRQRKIHRGPLRKKYAYDRWSPTTLTLLRVSILLLLSPKTIVPCHAARQLTCNKIDTDTDIAICSYRDAYEDEHQHQHPELRYGNAGDYTFPRFSSPAAVKNALTAVRGSSKQSFQYYQGKDGRQGRVSTTKLSGDWVLAESEQTAVRCTTRDVLRAYLSGDLQQRWNHKEVLECQITACPQAPAPPNTVWKSKRSNGGVDDSGAYYQQDLVLRSQRIILSHTGIMRYSQSITIHKIGPDNYNVSIRLDPDQQSQDVTDRKPFDALAVHVGLQQKGEDVHIYAAGVMQVNRKVVPNLVVFDASGIAGSMAGKGTLWLASFFEQRHGRSST